MTIVKFCLDCERELDLGPGPKIKERLRCPHCGVMLEVINLDPVELDWVYDGPVTDSTVLDNWWSTKETLSNSLDPKMTPKVLDP